MEQPILSNCIPENTPELMFKVPSILTKKNIDELNSILSCSKCGIFVFVQYNEKPYPINGFEQDLFRNNVTSLYNLYKDCGKDFLKYFLSYDENGLDSITGTMKFSFLGGINLNRLKAVNKHYHDTITIRSYYDHNQYPDSPSDQENFKKCKMWFLRFCKHENPITEAHWSICNNELVRGSNLLYSILKQRLEEFEQTATDKQRTDLQKWYYDYSFDCFDTNVLIRCIYGIFKRRRSPKAWQEASAYGRSNLSDIKQKYKLKLQMCQKPVDPYKVLVETIDAYIPY